MTTGPGYPPPGRHPSTHAEELPEVIVVDGRFACPDHPAAPLRTKNALGTLFECDCGAQLRSPRVVEPDGQQ